MKAADGQYIGDKSATTQPFLGAAEPWRSPKHALRDAILVPMIALGVIAATFVPVRLAAPKAGLSEISVVSATNSARLAEGLAPLRSDDALAQAAAEKAKSMINEGYFAHYYNGHTPWEFIDDAAGSDWRLAGENLAKNYDQTDKLMDAWMASPAHKENILNAGYERIGVAVVRTTLQDGTAISVTVSMFTGG